MAVQAIAKGVRMSPRKVSVVASLVRNRSVADALTILEHTPRAAAKPVSKVIASARANAEHNHNYKPDSLQIVSISVTPASRITRYKKGRGYRGGYDRFQLKSSHISVTVDGEKRAPKKPATRSMEAQ
ncbi:50S ribosomal protein L22 [Candidatus Saccharibacteria bacterium]|nr:50S ribosomal protein L22 [Candidatus Saccharibacteria bacterium]